MKPWAAWALLDDGPFTDGRLVLLFCDTEDKAGEACDYLAIAEPCPMAGGWMKTEDLLTEEFSNHIKELAC